jgi:hypothetical protein
MDQIQNYEYEYKIGPIAWKASLAQGMFSYKASFMSKSIQLNQITNFGIGRIQQSGKDIDTQTSPDSIDSPLSQLLIAYQPDPSSGKKLIRMNVNTQDPQCKKFVKDFYEKFKNLYVGNGPLFAVTKALGISQRWIWIVTSLIIIIPIAYFALSVYYNS